MLPLRPAGRALACAAFVSCATAEADAEDETDDGAYPWSGLFVDEVDLVVGP